ncbi:MAG: hypothetical protein M1510_00825 [Nitrospirae bacterium]|nr:hypothetical protein [Nitrospirota bacterium]
MRYLYRSVDILSSSGLNYYIPRTEHEFKESLRAERMENGTVPTLFGMKIVV